MFITVKAFKTLIKRAFQGAGLTIGRHGEKLLFCGSYWAIEVERAVLPNKALAAVIELTGEIPADNELFKATKEGGIQYEIPETYWEVMKEAQKAGEEYKVTNVLLIGTGTDYRVLQSESKKVQLINDFFVEAVSQTEMDPGYETYLQGPMTAEGQWKAVYWKSEACALTTFLMAKDDMEENELLKRLEGLDLKG